jgi:hypothetical protein
VAREPFQSELQHHLGRAGWPLSFALDGIELFQKAADIDQDPGKFRSGGVKRMACALPRCDHAIGQVSSTLTAVAACDSRLPVRRGSWHHLGHREIEPQSLPGLQLVRLD